MFLLLLTHSLFRGYVVGGDQAFKVTTWCHSNNVIYNDPDCTADALEGYSATRIIVEWIFQHITNIFRFFQVGSEQRILLTHPEVLYSAGAILALAHQCILKTNKTSN